MGSSPPKADKSLQEERARQEAAAKAESDALKAKQEEDDRQRRIGLFGRRQLQTGTDLGYPTTLGPTSG
jgi:hypothetical protein